MTRRYVAFPVADGFLVGQEFNGDRSEMTRKHGLDRHVVRVNWPTIVALFSGCRTERDFCAYIQQAEKWYGYEPIPVKKVDALPVCEELWSCVNGQLTLTTRYGEQVDEAEDDIYYGLRSEVEASVHMEEDGRVFQMLDGLSHLPMPYTDGEHNYTSQDLDDMQAGELSAFMPMYGNENPLCTELVRVR